METKVFDDSSSMENEAFAPEYRDRLRTWLEKMINSGSIPGLCWENKEQTIFRMPWKHAGRQDYNLEEDSKIFMAWAIHSGRYREGIDKPEPIVWKTRLRCALNKMPDIRELPERSRLDISEPYRVYQLLPPVHKASQIRRRLYKRSHSHETDHAKSYSDQIRIGSLVNSPDNQEGEWAKKIGIQRRNSVIETTRINLTKPRTSPLTSEASAAQTPGFWFSPSATMPIKPPMASALSGGIHVPRPITLDPTSSLHTLGHSRYPLVSSLHNPFAQFSSAAISSFFPTTTNLETFKQLGLMDQSLFSRQKYNGPLSHLVRKLDHDKKLPAEELKTHFTDSSLENRTPIKPELPSPQISAFPNDIKRDLSSSGLTAAREPINGHQYANEKLSLQDQLNELQRRIVALERDLEQSRSAHAHEKKAREELEEEKEKMNSTLKQMEENFRVLASYVNPRKDVFTKNFQIPLTQNENKMLGHFEVSRLLQSDHSRRILSDTVKHLYTSSMTSHALSVPNMATTASGLNYPQSKEGKKSPTPQRQTASKRPNSPLDLTVPSPDKKPKLFFDEGDNRSDSFPLKFSPINPYVTPALMISSRSLSNDDKPIATSPLSGPSTSPDSDVTQSEHRRTGFRSTSLSPTQRNATLLQSYPQRQGTIQVT